MIFLSNGTLTFTHLCSWIFCYFGEVLFPGVQQQDPTWQQELVTKVYVVHHDEYLKVLPCTGDDESFFPTKGDVETGSQGH